MWPTAGKEKDKMKHSLQCGHCKADLRVDIKSWEIVESCSSCKRRKDDPENKSQLQSRHSTERSKHSKSVA